jgi:hypothetical protein
MPIKYSKGLTSAMNNVDASVLGSIALEAGAPNRTDVGDSIDRGLILRRLLEEQGYLILPLHRTNLKDAIEAIKAECEDDPTLGYHQWVIDKCNSVL